MTKFHLFFSFTFWIIHGNLEIDVNTDSGCYGLPGNIIERDQFLEKQELCTIQERNKYLSLLSSSCQTTFLSLVHASNRISTFDLCMCVLSIDDDITSNYDCIYTDTYSCTVYKHRQACLIHYLRRDLQISIPRKGIVS